MHPATGDEATKGRRITSEQLNLGELLRQGLESTTTRIDIVPVVAIHSRHGVAPHAPNDSAAPCEARAGWWAGVRSRHDGP